MKSATFTVFFPLLLFSLTASAEEEFEIEIEYETGHEQDGGAPADASTVPEAEEIINFQGILKEKGTRRPVRDLTLYLKNTDYSAVSDENGSFTFHNLPPRKYTVIIPSVMFEKFETEEEVRKGEITEVVYYLDPKVYGDLEVVVHGQKVKKEVSRKALKKKELMLIPGATGDSTRVVESLPGVARGVGGSTYGGAVVIRGSNAEDSKIYLDGHEIPLLMHFGGLKSVYNSELLDEINLYTGGFGAQFANATGGIVELKSRGPRTDRWGGYGDLSLIDMSAMAEGPVSDDMGIALAARRSTLDLFWMAEDPDTGDISFVTLPAYYDYQAKWNYDITDNHSISLDIYGAHDEMAMLTELVGDEDPVTTGGMGMTFASHSAFVHYRYRDRVFESDFSPGYAYTLSDVEVGKDLYITSQAHVTDINEHLRIRLHEHNTIGLGAQIQPRYWILESDFIQPPKEGDVYTNFTNDERIQTDITVSDVIGGLFLYDELEAGPFLFVPGVRFDYESHLNIFAASPRGTIRYRVIDPLVLKTAVGMYHRVPDPDEIVEPFGNRGLDFEQAVHYILGFEWAITDIINVDVQGYYKQLDNLVTTIKDPAPGDGRIYDNSAEGYVYGGEILLRHNWTDDFFGWISYSVSRSMRNDGPGTEYRRFSQDQTHNLIALASWQFAKGWRLGGRFQFTSGEPYTEIKGGTFNADNGTYLPVYDMNNKNNEEMPPFHRLDLRLDKEWVFNTWILTTYLDVQGVYYHSNPVGVAYNYDYSEKMYFKDLPIIPSIGVKAEF